MKRYGLFALILTGLFLTACQDYICNDDGVTIKVTDSSVSGPKLVRLKVIGDKIIHVSAMKKN